MDSYPTSRHQGPNDKGKESKHKRVVVKWFDKKEEITKDVKLHPIGVCTQTF